MGLILPKSNGPEIWVSGPAGLSKRLLYCCGCVAGAGTAAGGAVCGAVACGVGAAFASGAGAAGFLFLSIRRVFSEVLVADFVFFLLVSPARPSGLAWVWRS